MPHFADDSFISLRYAQRLIEGHGLTWNDGERVEGYSNFLWVLLTAAFGLLTPHGLIAVARCLGLACTAAALGGVVFGFVPKNARELLGLGWGLLAITLSGPVAAWAIGGLEQPLLTALVVWAVVLARPLVESDQPSQRRMLAVGVLLGLASLTRPDGILFVVATALAIVVCRGLNRRALRTAATVGLAALALTAAHVAFRRLYYDAWVPNTYYAKVAFTGDRLKDGVHWLGYGVGYAAGATAPVLLAVLAAASDRTRRKRIVLSLVPLVIWAAYLVLMSRDAIPYRRHFVPLIFLAVLAGIDGLTWLSERGRRWGLTTAAPLALLLLGLVVIVQRGAWERNRLLTDQSHWAGKPIGILFHHAFSDADPLLAVDAAGALPYFSRLRCLDMLGLNDRFLAHHQPKTFGHGVIGHELGDGQYFLRRKPDIVVFHMPNGRADAYWRGGIEMQRAPEFSRLYRLVHFRAREPFVQDNLSYLRLDGKVGIQRSPQRVVIPGYLMAGRLGSVAELDEQGRLAAVVSDEAPAQIDGVELPRGRWRATAESSEPLIVSVATAGDRAAAAESIGAVEVTHATTRRGLRFGARTLTGNEVRLYRLVLTPVR